MSSISTITTDYKSNYSENQIKHSELGTQIGSKPVTESAERLSNYIKDTFVAPTSAIIAQNPERQIFHLRAPDQLAIYQNSSFAKATPESEYCAQYTTCGWMAAYLAHNLCRILSEDVTIHKEDIEERLDQLIPEMFIRNATSFVGDLTPYGGSDDKVEGLLLGEDIYAILKGTNTPYLENVFVIEGATEEETLKLNAGILEVFNVIETFRANYKNLNEFSPLKNAINEVASGKKSFMILVSLETFPIGKHFITYAFRRNAQDSLECLIFEGLNEIDNNWVFFESSDLQDTIRRVTTEWLYSDLRI